MNTSLRKQFTITILALIAIIAAVLTGLMFLISHWDHQQHSDQLANENNATRALILSRFSEELAAGLSLPMASGDLNQIANAVELTQRVSSISEISVSKIGQGLIYDLNAHLHPNLHALPTHPNEADPNQTFETGKQDETISVRSPIYVNDEIAGYVVLVLDLDLQPDWLFPAAGNQQDEFSGTGYLSYILLLLTTLVLMLLGGLVAYAASGRITRPIQQLQEQTRNIAQGMPPSEERIGMKNEIGDLASTIYDMAADLELQNRSVKYLAFHDPLTGLSNRVNFQMQLEDYIVDAANRRQSCAVMYIDVDDFKEINDTRSHEYGDRALRGIANRISSCLNQNAKAQDWKTPLLARVGGDEFTILLLGNLEKPALAKTAESILEQISEPLEIDGDLFQLSGSIGVALYPSDALSANELFNSADLAMYASKSAGKGTYRFFTASMSENREQIGQIKSEFKAALQNQDEISLVYQPVVDINTGAIIGAEALIRWDHPEKGPLLPNQFMSIVEHNEIALSADLWVISQVTTLLSKMDLEAKPNFRIAANMSASNLARSQFTSAVAKCIGKQPEIAKYLQLEVTETYLHKDEEHAKISLDELKTTGVSIWLDDFCTGYSSLNHLTIFPVDGIKVDRQFVSRLNENEDNRLLVKVLLNMSESFGIDLIAEGVDNTNDLHQLQQLGCKYAQGYLFSQPVSELELLRLLKDDIRLM